MLDSATSTSSMLSPVERLALLTPEQRAKVMASLSEAEQAAFPWAWREWWARPTQLAPPGNWRIWLALAGRGWGKTRVGAEQVRAWVGAGSRRIALVAPTAADARDVMVEGESGILAISPPGNVPLYEPSKRRLTWPGGAT